jgi:hypothetical protein
MELVYDAPTLVPGVLRLRVVMRRFLSGRVFLLVQIAEISTSACVSRSRSILGAGFGER